MSDRPQTPLPEQPPAPRKRFLGRDFLEDLSGLHVDWRGAVLVPVLALATALILSAIVIALTDIETLKLWGSSPGVAASQTWHEVSGSFVALFQGSLGGLRALSETLTAAAPLIIAGLALAVGFRAQLFNIGVEGQMMVGGLAAILVGTSLDFSALGSFAILIHLPLTLLAGALGGMVWGGIPGLLKARTGAHEVVVTIMLNNIARVLTPWVLLTNLFRVPGREDPISKPLEVSARLPRLLGFLEGSRPASDIRVHAGIILALLLAVAVYWLLFRTKLGFQIRALGFNPDAAHYAGMKVTWLFVGAMAISGALAGIAGTNQVAGVLGGGTAPGFTGGIGFDAISVALLGRSHPAGVVMAGLLFGALRAGGQQMQVATDVPIDLILVVQALVVVFIAAPALIRAIYRVRTGEAHGQLVKGTAV
jgi:ABC-type uncharacterized transport system permease subunit